MARFTKSILAAGTYSKAGETIRVTPGDLRTAIESHKKIVSRGYKIPVIMEHAASNDKAGLPFKSKSEQMSPRDLAKYQEGWSDIIRLNKDGTEIEADIDVKGADGLKLIREIGTYISPQFGRWADPETGEVLPMAITHLALTPFPVDIGQNPEFKEIPENGNSANGGQILEASQLSHLVSFSMADLVDFGQKTLGWGEDDEAKHPRDHGKFTTKSGGSSGGSGSGSAGSAADDEPFTLKREKDNKFVPKKQTGIQTDLFGKTKTTVSPADAHVKPQVESLAGQKTISDTKPDFHHMARIAAGYQLHGMNAEPEDRAGSREHQKHMTKSALDAWLMKKYGLDSAEARSVSNAAGEMNAVETSGSGTVGGESAKWTHHSPVPTAEELGDVPWKKREGIEDPVDAAILKHLESGGKDIYELSKHTGIKNGPGHDPLKSKLNQSLARLVKSGKIEAKSAWSGSNNFTFHLPKSSQMSHYDAEAAVRAKLHQMSLIEAFAEANGTNSNTSQMGQSMPFPPKKPGQGQSDDASPSFGSGLDSGDTDADDDGIVDSQDPDAGTGAFDPTDEMPTDLDDNDADDAAKIAVQDHLDDAKGNDGDAETWAQIGAALKICGVIVPDATNPHALLAGLLTCAHHTQKADAKDASAMGDQAQDDVNGMTDPNQINPQSPQARNPTQPNPSQPNPSMGGQDPRLKGTRQEQAFTMSQNTATTAKSAMPANGKKVVEVPISEWTQMSLASKKMEERLSKLERENYESRIKKCFETGRMSKPDCDELMAVAGTFQFSTGETSAEIRDLNTTLKFAEKLPEGAVWSPQERMNQMSVQTEGQPGFFSVTGTASAAPEVEDAELDRRFGKFVA